MKDTVRYFKVAYIVLISLLLPLPFLLLVADFFVYFGRSGTTISYIPTIVMAIAITIVGFTVFRKSKTSGEPKTMRFFPGLGLASLIAFFVDVFVYRLIYPFLGETFRRVFYLETGNFFLNYLGEIMMALIIIIVGFTVFFRTSTPESPKSKLFLSRLGWTYLILFFIGVAFLIFGLVVTAIRF